jgi:hypothetical protein
MTMNVEKYACLTARIYQLRQTLSMKDAPIAFGKVTFESDVVASLGPWKDRHSPW